MTSIAITNSLSGQAAFQAIHVRVVIVGIGFVLVGGPTGGMMAA